MLSQVLEPVLDFNNRFFRSIACTELCGKKWASEPWPDCTLVVSAVSTPDIPFIAPTVSFVLRRQCSQAIRSQQLTLYNIENLTSALRSKEAVVKTCRKYLIGTHRSVQLGTISDVVEIFPLFIPKYSLEVRLQFECEFSVVFGGKVVAEQSAEVFERA